MKRDLLIFSTINPVGIPEDILTPDLNTYLKVKFPDLSIVAIKKGFSILKMLSLNYLEGGVQGQIQDYHSMKNLPDLDLF